MAPRNLPAVLGLESLIDRLAWILRAATIPIRRLIRQVLGAVSEFVKNVLVLSLEPLESVNGHSANVWKASPYGYQSTVCDVNERPSV